MIQAAKRNRHLKPPDAVAAVMAKLGRISFLATNLPDGQSRLAVTETVDKGAWRSAVLVGRADWSQLATAQRLAEAMLGQLTTLGYLPSHASRKRAALLALEILWGLPSSGWQLSAGDVWAWYYRRVSGPELRRRIASGGLEVGT